MASIVETFSSGIDPIPMICGSAAITGGQVVALTGPRTIGPAGADSAKIIGVALHDATEGDAVSVAGPGWTVPVVATGAVSAGDKLVAAADGTVKTYVAPTSVDGAPLVIPTILGVALDDIATTKAGSALVTL